MLSACYLSGAESFPVVGAYFPGWLICLFIGILSTIGFRIIALKLNLDRFLSFRLFTYLSLGAIVGLAVWTICFGS